MDTWLQPKGMVAWWRGTVTVTKSHKLCFRGTRFSPAGTEVFQHWHLALWWVSLVQQRTDRAEAPFNVSKKDRCSLFHRQLRTQSSETSGVWLGYLKSLPESSGAVVLQMLLVFIARPVLWKAQHFCKSGWFSQCVVRMGPRASHPWRCKTHGSRNSPTCPEGLIQSSRELVWVCPGECGRIAGLCPMQGGGGGEGGCLGEGTSLCMPPSGDGTGWGHQAQQPWYPAGRLSLGVLMTSGDTITMGKESLGDTAMNRLGYPLPKSGRAFLWSNAPNSFSPQSCQCSGPISWATGPCHFFWMARRITVHIYSACPCSWGQKPYVIFQYFLARM